MIVLAFLITLATLALAVPDAGAQATPTYTVGPRVTVLGHNAGGLSMFPEAPITVLKTSPQYEVLIPAALKTAYCKGPAMNQLVATGFALSPSSGRSYDRVSAHITSAWTDPVSGDLYAAFNGNDSDDVPRFGPGAGFRGRYHTAALAKSTNGGVSFTKIGPIVSVPKNAGVGSMQGNAFGAVVMSPDKQWLYLYYGDMYNGMLNGGIQTCVARAPAASQGMPGAWKKWYGGAWSMPGLSVYDSTTGTGLEASPVVGNHVSLYGDAMYPHVSWSDRLGAYVMVYAINVTDEAAEPDSAGNYPPLELSGIYIAFSVDGVSWGARHQLVKAITIDYPGREVALHPTLVLDEQGSGPTNLKATLYYGYSSRMWLGNPATQYLVSHSVSITGLSPEQYSSRLAPSTRRSPPAPAFSLLPLGQGTYRLRFLSDPGALRLVTANGAAAPGLRRLTPAEYLLGPATRGRPLFLQGRSRSNVLILP